MKTKQEIISAEFYIESGEYNKPTLIVDVLEKGNIKRNRYEFQRYREFERSTINFYIAIIYFSNNLYIGITETNSHVSLYYNYEDRTTRTLLAILEKTDDNRFLYGKSLEKYKEKVKIEEKKEITNYASELIMKQLNIKVYEPNYTLNILKNK
jgi:hypothetical protein